MSLIKLINIWLKGFSYLHTSWIPASDIENDKIAKQKLQRYLKNLINGNNQIFDEEEPFNPDFIQVIWIFFIII